MDLWNKTKKAIEAFRFQDEQEKGRKEIRRILTKEISDARGILNRFMKWENNPDEVVAKKGFGKLAKTYDNMVDKDAHVYSVLDTRKKALLGLGWEITPFVGKDEDEPSDKNIEIARTIQELIDRITNFRHIRHQMLLAYNHGYSVGEIIYKVWDDGLIGIDTVKSRVPDFFKFDADGNLLYVPGVGSEIAVPENKFLVYTFNERYENRYGISLLKVCYWPYWFKSSLIKYLMIFSERYGTPPLWGTYPKNWSDSEIANFLNDLENMLNRGVGVKPEGGAVEHVETKGQYEDAYIKSMQYFDDSISKAIIGQTLTSGEGRRSGSLALGDVHELVRQDILQDDAADSDGTINDQLIKPLTSLNFGDSIEGFPKYRTLVPQPDDLKTRSEIYETLVNLGQPISLKHVSERFKIPLPAEDEPVLTGATALEVKEEQNEFANRKKGATIMFQGDKPVGPTFDMGSSLAFRDDFRKILDRILRQISEDVLDSVALGAPLEGLIDQAVRRHMGPEFSQEMINTSVKTISTTAGAFADQFGQLLTPSTFTNIRDKYLQKHFGSEIRSLQGMRSHITDLLKSKIPEWQGVGFDTAQMKDLLRKEYSNLAEWKVNQIAQTEMNEAANATAFDMVQQTGLDFQAYFLIDPGSCVICQEWASRNPYTVEQAKSMGLPHIQCNDQWTFEFIGEA